MTTETEAPIESGLVILDKRETGLRLLAQEFKGLRVNGVGDKEGLAVLSKSRKILKSERVGLEKDGELLRESAVQFSKKVIARVKELTAIIAPIEDELQAEEKRIEAEKEAIRIEKERRENDRIQGRVNALAQFNYAVDVYELKIMSDLEFETLLAAAEADYEVQQQKVIAEKAAEEQRRKDEEEKLRLERVELARQKAEYEEREKMFQARLEKEEREQSAKEAALRAHQEKIARDQADKEAAIWAEQEKLADEKRKYEEMKRADEAKKLAEENAARENAERIERELEAKMETDRLASLEEKRKEAIRPDKEKLLAYYGQVSNIPLPELSDPELRNVLQALRAKITTAFDWMVDFIK